MVQNDIGISDVDQLMRIKQHKVDELRAAINLIDGHISDAKAAGNISAARSYILAWELLQNELAEAKRWTAFYGRCAA